MKSMDQLSFDLSDAEEPGKRYVLVEPRINGVPLTDLMRTAELRNLGGRDASVAGAYDGLWAGDVLPPSRHFLGNPVAPYVAAYGRVIVMGCSCGESGCWPLECRIDVGTEEVVWSSFRNPHLGLHEYEGVGPFRFDRQQYESALLDAAERSRPRT